MSAGLRGLPIPGTLRARAPPARTRMLPPAASASQSSSPSAFLYVLLYSQSEMEADVLAHEHSAHAEHLALLAARARALKRDNEEAAFRYQEVMHCTPRHSKSGGTVPALCAAGWQLKSGGLLVAEYLLFGAEDFPTRLQTNCVSRNCSFDEQSEHFAGGAQNTRITVSPAVRPFEFAAGAQQCSLTAY